MCLHVYLQAQKNTERKSAILTIQKITYQQRNTQKENGMTCAHLRKIHILLRKYDIPSKHIFLFTPIGTLYELIILSKLYIFITKIYTIWHHTSFPNSWNVKHPSYQCYIFYCRKVNKSFNFAMND